VDDPRAVVLSLHGGGFYLGSAAANDVADRRLADELGAVVVSVEHRLAPEDPWPAAPDDCETAALWVAARFPGLPCGVVGFSAGSNLALVTLGRLRDRGSSPVTAAVLQFGAFDLSGQTPGGRAYADEWFIRAYAGAVDRTHPDVSPAYADVTGLPPVLVVVGDADPVLADNVAMARRLGAAGVETELRVHPEAPHGFTQHPTPIGRAAREDLAAWLGQRLGPVPPRPPTRASTSARALRA
jgi:acetyl esterase/lipase